MRRWFETLSPAAHVRRGSACSTALIAGALLFTAFASGASAQAVKPWFLLLLDTSGSMCENDVNPTNSCGFPKNIKMNAAKCAIQNILNQTGDAEFGLAQFSQNMNCTGNTAGSDVATQGLMRYGIAPSSPASILTLVDGTGAPTGDCNGDGSTVATGDITTELCSGGGTPTSGALRMVEDYFRGAHATFTAPTKVEDQALGCRPMNVIVMTDGMSNSGGLPQDRATELFNSAYMRVPNETRVGACPLGMTSANCVPVRIKTYAIGFGGAVNNAEIEAIATNGGTDNSIDGAGGLRGYYAGDEAELSEALARIIFESQLNEVCNGVDDDCDSRVDEGSAAYCDADGIRARNPQVSWGTTTFTSAAGQGSITGSTFTETSSYVLSADDVDAVIEVMSGTSLGKRFKITAFTSATTATVTPSVSAATGTFQWKLVKVFGPPDGSIVDQNLTASILGTDSNLFAYSCNLANSPQCSALSGNALINCCADFGNCCAAVPGDATPPVNGYAECAAPEYDLKDNCSPMNLLCTSPGELCDGEDNDCDGTSDEGPFVGTVPPELCNNGTDDDCDGNADEGCATCVPEICNNIDDDCDLLVDEDLVRSCGFDLGSGFPASICEAGEETCVKGQYGAICPMGTINGPTCNINVLDSDRQIGDPFPTGWVQHSDSTGAGGTCVPPRTEICDDLDNDCNTLIDDLAPTACASVANIPLANLPRGICKAGLQFCDPDAPGDVGPCLFEVTPQVEICNGLDDDCDTFTDEAPGTNPTHALINRPCGTDAGICVRGTETCNASTGVFGACIGATTPGTEECNAVPGAPDQSLYDEDCDSRVDETDNQIPGTCVPNPDGSPATAGPNAGRGECTEGNVQCIDGVEKCEDYQGPTPELCDDQDRDCDGAANNGVGPTSATPGAPNGTDPTLGTACFPPSYDVMFPEALPGLGACIPGKLVCDLTAMPSGTTCVQFGVPSLEVCDGQDNDCDASVDEDVYAPGATCQRTPPHVPPIDTCSQCTSRAGEVVVCRESLVDDDDANPTTCVAMGYGAPINHGGVADCCGNYATTSSWDFGSLVGPHDGEGLCALGTPQCVNGDEVCNGEVIPVDEVCDNFDNDCDGQTDELIPTDGQPCGDDTGECERGNLECQGIGGMVCVGADTGGDEFCDGLDNDCDGFYDEMNPEGGADCGGNTANCMRREDPANTSQAETVPCGDCAFGVEVCVTVFDSMDNPIGASIQCLGDIGPIDEICDGRDNDCDSKCLVDSNGDVTCPPEMPDADEKIDEGVETTDPNVGEACGEDEGECDSGFLVCEGGGLVCDGAKGPTTEVCNAKDDDCDGIKDDGIAVGAPCGEDTGECLPGMQVCNPDTGELECEGEIGPKDEECNNLDDNCNGEVDEGLGLGDDCGTAEGLCELGELVCVRGRTVCSGEVGPTPEVCDCEDNDCDGKVDEDTGDEPICPGVGGVASQCLMCQCALPCSEPDEFNRTCPQGKAAVDDEDGVCFCVGELCNQVKCQGETIENKDGDVQCAPDSNQVGTCRCKNNECSFVCSGVICEQGLACDPTDGKCKQATCLLTQFACPAGERCGVTGGVFGCIEDACKDVTCEATQACRDGDCIGSCGKVTCQGGQKCVDGECVEDKCSGVTCQVNEVCDPEDGDCVMAGACHSSGCSDGQVCEPVEGDCVEDPCLGTHCPYGEQCESATGQCMARCAGNRVFCDEACVDPTTNRVHCGAKDDCMGSNAGEACGDGLVCNVGACSDKCQSGLVNCDGECIDPKTDQNHCGAKDSCDGADRGNLCRTGFACDDGKCAAIAGGGGGTSGGGGGAGAGSGALAEGSRVIASGGGGCACSVPGAADARSTNGRSTSARGPWALALLSLMLLALGRRRALWRGAWLVRRAAPLAVVVLTLFGGSGCKVDPFCLDCPIPGQPDGVDSGTGVIIPGADGSFVEPVSGTGGGSGTSGNGGTGGTAGDGGAPIQPDGGCVDGAEEICNGIDDDCDDKTDEDADPAKVNIDIQTDPRHCGGCGQACEIPHAFNDCVDAKCVIDRKEGDNGCDIGYVDVDGELDNGCEYRCTATADDDSDCDLVDNDCDTEVDEDVAFATDKDNCGQCGFTCRFANAEEGGTCVNEACALDDSKCDEGFKNLDGIDDNGCERNCPVFPTIDELCNNVDDDCDGERDEDVGTTDPDVGDDCGTDEGECEAGTKVCVNGTIECQGETEATTELCNGDDDDCDGDTDESDPLLSSNPACGSSVGACERGVLQCVGGDIVCGGATLVQPAADELCNHVDDDCDGLIDEEAVIDDNGTTRKLEDGIACSTRGGSLDITPSSPAVGACSYGELACQNGVLACRDEIVPAAELCDNVDQDCDGAPVPAVPNSVSATDPRVGVTCGNQLGICEPGTMQCINSGTVGTPNWVVQCSAGSVVPEPSETCDGEDDDCDGRFDEMATGTGANNCHLEDNGRDLNNDGDLTDAGENVKDGVFETYVATPLNTGECDSGDTFCSGGRFACIGYQGPKTEVCNGLDDDCDGTIDDMPRFAGTPCNVLSGTIGSTMTWDLFGVCTAGTWTCPAPATAMTTGLQCVGGVRPAANELCNGLDDNCNGSVDEGWVASGGQPAPGSSCCPNDPSTTHVDVCNSGPAYVSCQAGTNQCAGGTVSCIQANWSPSTEICDLSAPQRDNDCDGNIDEGFRNGMGQYTSINNCGGCGVDCRAPGNQIDNAIMECAAGSCEIATCLSGYFDDPNVGGTDCELYCPFFAGDIELCDGEDNDCDGNVDEAPDLQGPVASTFCDQDGACSGAVPVCTDIGSGVKGWECDKAPAPEQCTFNAGTPGVSTIDEDCDGRVDEGVTLKAGFTAGAQGVGVTKTCSENTGTGLCKGTGVQVCDQANTSRTTCVVSISPINLAEVTTNTAARADEVCDGKDNDCDGSTDEPCESGNNLVLCRAGDTTCLNTQREGGVPGGVLLCVMDGWAQLDSDTWIYTHEASRPDAAAGTAGVLEDRACSRTTRKPWTSISYDEAQNACESAGAHLCTRGEWRQACSCGGTGTTGSSPNYDYQWPSAGSCTSTAATAVTQCNIADATGAVDATGANASCYVNQMSTGIFDLTGNVKELTAGEMTNGTACDPADTGCRIQVRGGASTNTAVGSACGYSQSFWPDDAPFYNVGFRCCSGPDPRPVFRCGTFNGSAGSATSGADISSALNISGSLITSISEVRLNLAGVGSSDFDDLDFRLVRGANNLLMVDATNCTGNVTLAYNMAFSDTAAAGPDVNGACSNLTTGVVYRPSDAFAPLDGTAADGTWTLNVIDTDTGDSTTLTSWSLQICGTGPAQ